MSTRSQLVLAATLRLLQPLVRLLMRQGVAYPAFAAALKTVFVDEARRELAGHGRPVTDSALTLLSGVHRRDLRRLGRGTASALAFDAAPLSLAGEVVGRWMSEPGFQAEDGTPRVLPRSGEGSFDALVQRVSQDVRPRAVLDEMMRLGVAREVVTDRAREAGAAAAPGEPAAVALVGDGLAPRQGFEELSALFSANLHDHLAAATANLQGEANFLEQAVYVDQISAESAQSMQQVSVAAWREAMRGVMQHAQARFDADAGEGRPAPAAQPRHRARFGVYFFSEPENTP
jgi:hypothetical protein